MIQVRRERPLSRPLLLATVAMGGILAPLNSTMLAVALPELRDAFSVGHVAVGWLVSSYLIAMAVAQPLGGRLGDQLGRARVFRSGLVAFLILSLAAALSPSFPVLVLLRTGQALVGAAVIPNGLAMLRETLPSDRLGRSMGLTSSAISFAAAVGPLIGTGLLAAGSWRLLFLVNAPLVLAALVCQGFLRYPEPRRRPLELDWRGAVAFGVALAALTVVLGSLRGDGNRLVLAASVPAFVLVAALFIQSQRATTMPVVAWGLFRSRSYVGATGYVMLTNLIIYTTLVSIPFFVEEVQRKGSGTSGTLLGAMSILFALVAPIGGRLSDRLGRRAPALVSGLIIICATAMLLLGMSDGVSYGYLAAALALLGLGMGLGFGPATTAAIESAPPDLAGTAAGTNSMMRYVGSIVGVGILGAVLGSAGSEPEVGLFRAVFAVLLGMSALAAMTTLLIHRRLPSRGEQGSVAEPAVASPVGVSGS